MPTFSPQKKIRIFFQSPEPQNNKDPLSETLQRTMCFFALYRYRVCQHDQIGPFVAFCTTAKTQVYSDEYDNAQSSSREWRRYGGSPDSIITTDDCTKFTYCGQPLFSPAYIIDFGSDSENFGICQNCNLGRELRYEDEERIDNYTRLVGNAGRKTDLLKSNHDQPIPMRTTTDMSSQPHFLGSGAESYPLSGPSLSRYRPLRAGTLRCCSTPPPPLYLSHPPPQPTQQAVHAPCRSRLLPLEHLSHSPGPVIIANSRNPEHPTNLFVALQQMPHNYPPRTRAAIEKAIENQPPEQRTQTSRALQTCFEEEIRRYYRAQGAEPAPIVAAST